MTRRSYVGARFVPVIGLLLILATAPSIADAHGIGASDPNRPVAEYTWLGFKHLIVGWDHLLFILGIVLLAGELWRATKLISWFVLGHSITLMLATTQEWTVSTTFVDIVIALSLVMVAVIAYRGRPTDWRPLGAALFVIGLIHGLGLGTRLLEVGVSDNDLTWRILAFNIGVELGQAVAVIAFTAILYALTRYAPAFRKVIVQPTFVLIATAGIVGTVVIAVTGNDHEPARTAVAQSEDAAAEEATENCTRDTATSPPMNNAGHPERQFYGPNEVIPHENFDHILGDGYVVVTYNPELPTSEVTQLRQAIEGEDKAVVGGPSPGQTEAIIATTARRTLTCTDLDVPALLGFRDAWFQEIYG